MILFVFTCHSMSVIIIRMAQSTIESLEPWLSVEELAKYLSVSRETIYRWLEKKKVPAHRVGRLWRFKPSEIDAWVKSGDAE
jgi:excisionase family DNA binding protein